MPIFSFPRPALPRPPALLLSNLPRMLRGPVRHTPFVLQRLVTESLLQRIFKEAIEDGDFDFLENRCVKLEISDIGLHWHIGYQANKLRLLKFAHADVVIRGDLNEFLLLASRQEDPDTLFFQRRLVIEGDTDLGLEVKNCLDGIEMDSLPAYLQKILHLLSA